MEGYELWSRDLWGLVVRCANKRFPISFKLAIKRATTPFFELMNGLETPRRTMDLNRILDDITL